MRAILSGRPRFRESNGQAAALSRKGGRPFPGRDLSILYQWLRDAFAVNRKTSALHRGMMRRNVKIVAFTAFSFAMRLRDRVHSTRERAQRDIAKYEKSVFLRGNHVTRQKEICDGRGSDGRAHGRVGLRADRRPECGLARLSGRHHRQQIQAAGPDQRLELLQAGSGVALQDRQYGQPSRIQAGRHAAGSGRRGLCHRRFAPRRGRAGRGDGRASLGPWREGRRARRRRSPPAFGPRSGLLDRWQGSPHSLYHARLSADRLDAKTGQRIAIFRQ